MPNAELHFIDECGHAPMIEHPNEFNEIMVGWLKRLAEAPSMASIS
jgi:pimeloyl-ACP methyl ester carboxylesterase